MTAKTNCMVADAPHAVHLRCARLTCASQEKPKMSWKPFRQLDMRTCNSQPATVHVRGPEWVTRRPARRRRLGIGLRLGVG